MQQQSERERENSYGGRQNKNDMLKEIQSIVGEIGGTRKALNNNINVSNVQAPRNMKYNPGSSRLMNDSDFSNFSIKDAINRPNQFTFY